MKIHFIGLSCFLIENEAGFRILIDPFHNSPEWSLGPKFPEEFQGKSFGTNVVLMSEPDADHSYSRGDWLQYAPRTKPHSDPFPDFDLKGSFVYEYNGDLNIAYQYTVDGLRLAHFADNAYLLSDKQLKEIGSPDIIFISPPKVTADNNALDVVRQNINLLNPKIVIWSHHIVPKSLPFEADSETLRLFFKKYFKETARTNQFYKGEESFIQLCYVLENALLLNKEYNGLLISETLIEVNKQSITSLKEKPQSFLFTSMLAQ